MDYTLLLAFVTTSLIFVLTPGPSVAFVTSQALRHGRRAAYMTVAGDALAAVVQITIAASSITYLISLSEVILPPLQFVGGMFIVYLGYRSFLAVKASESDDIRSSDQATFWSGFFACLSNPKAIFFFVALFPAFISPDHSILLQTIVYGVIFLVMDACMMLGYAFLSLRTVESVASKWINTNFLSGIGLTLVGLGMMIMGYRSFRSN